VSDYWATLQNVALDFNKNQVFESVGKQVEPRTELVMRGVIHRFDGEAEVSGVGFLIIPPMQLFWLTGLPIAKDDGEVNLEISLERPDGVVLGTYQGQSTLSKHVNWYQAAGSTPVLHRNMNLAFSGAIAQIREQILKDEVKLSRQP
jgi:hypothetical protein